MSKTSVFTCLVLLSVVAVASSQTTPTRKLPLTEPLEKYGDPPARIFRIETSPRMVSQYGPFTSFQANVDAQGHNIVGDAANEPSISVDPTNGNKMAITWRQFNSIQSNFRQAGYGYTTDGGTTWTFPGVLENNVFRSDPVSNSDETGKFFYLSLRSDQAQSFFCDDVWRSLNGGQSWTQGGPAHGGDKEWFTIDKTTGMGHGFQYQFWTGFFACDTGEFSRSTDGGVTWMTPINIPNDVQTGTLDVDTNGNLFIGGTAGQFWCLRSSNAQNGSVTPTFDQVTSVNLGGSLVQGGINGVGLCGQLFLTIDRSGTGTNNNIYMLASVEPNGASNGTDVMFVRSTNGGQTFSTPRRINDDPVNQNKWHWLGTLAVAPNGRLDSVWLDTRNAANNTDSQLFYSYSTDAGSTWSPNVAVSMAFNPFLGYPSQNKIGDYITIVSDNTGGDVAYPATFNLEEDVYYVRVAPGVTPPTPTPSPTSTPSPSPTPTATATGTPSPSPTCVPDEPPLLEGFDDITTLPGNDWVLINHSAVVGTTNWFQGNSATFPAQSGAATSYIGANFNNTTGTNTISNWLLTTPLPLLNGRTMTFFTRTVDAPTFPDRLQVRMSTNGTSSNVGTTATDVGDFTTLLLDINPTYTTSGYPNVWTQFTVTVSGVPSFTTGRLAFRYFVENGGPTGANSDYIGIDTFQFNDNGPCSGATPTATATATIPPTVTPIPSECPSCTVPPFPTPTPSPTPTQSPTSTPTPTPSSTPVAQPLDLSTRMLVQTGDNVGIGGFIITGSAPKQMVLRGIGPSLANFGVPDPLADPILELHGPPGFVTIINDNWRDGNCPLSGLPPTNDLESAICATLDPGAYTAVLRGKDNGTGVGLVEVYDVGQAAPSKLANISTRAFVGTGADNVIAGFILGGNTGSANIIARGIGPSLTAFGVPDALADPTLELRDNNGALIRADNDWQDDPAQAALISAAGLAPTNNLESGIAATLAPGQYTALLAGLNNGVGVGLVEVYDIGTP